MFSSGAFPGQSANSCEPQMERRARILVSGPGKLAIVSKYLLAGA